jgi:hypothetical protein
MADQITNSPVVPATPAVAAPVAPVVAAPEAPVVQNVSPVVNSPVVETPVVTTPVVEAKAAPVVAETSVLGEEPPKPVEVKPAEAKTEVKAADVKTEGEVKTEVKAEVAEPVQLPSYDGWKFPEGVEADPEKLSVFNKIFGEFETTSKVEHTAMEALGQKLIDFNIEQINALRQAYVDKWNQDKKDWFESFQKDPEIGGNRAETVTQSVRQFVETYGGNPEQKTELRNFLKTTGIGNHPALIRLIANASVVRQEGGPVPANKGPQAPISKIQKRYGKTE